MKVYIPYYHEYDEETCNCCLYDDACLEAMNRFDERMEQISKPTFKVARKTRQEAVIDLGKHIITEERFKEFYTLLLDTRDKTSLKELGEQLHLVNFLERCQNIDSKDEEGLKKEFVSCFIKQVMDKIIPEQRVPFPVENFKIKYCDYRYMYVDGEYLKMINQKHDSIKQQDIINYINVNVADLIYTLSLKFRSCKREFTGKSKDWEDKLNSVNSWEEFRHKFYHQVIQDCDYFDQWVSEYTYYGIQEYEIV